jgi:5-methylcytosine-specific restriction endonuclease McrA
MVATAPDVLLQQVHDAIDALLAAPVDALDPTEQHRRVIALHAEQARLSVAFAQHLDRWQAGTTWASDGSRTPAHRLANATHSSLASARTDIARARRLRHTPAVRDEVIAGRMSLDDLHLFGRACTPARAQLYTRDESMLVDQARTLRHTDVKALIRYWQHAADDHLTNHTTHDPLPDSTLHLSATLDDTYQLTGTLGPIDGHIIDNELRRLERQLQLTDRTEGRHRTPAQRRAAALVEMATRSATTPADGQRPAPLFSVVIGNQAFEHLCEIGYRTVLRPEHLTNHLDQAAYETLLFDGPTTIVSVSRQRTFTGTLRRAIQIRDRHCQHPSGCDEPAERCDVDHIRPTSRGGRTSQADGRIQCWTHNRNPHFHDHDATPAPERTLDRLDELRIKIRWRTDYEDRLIAKRIATLTTTPHRT